MQNHSMTSAMYFKPDKFIDDTYEEQLAKAKCKEEYARFDQKDDKGCPLYKDNLRHPEALAWMKKPDTRQWIILQGPSDTGKTVDLIGMGKAILWTAYNRYGYQYHKWPHVFNWRWYDVKKQMATDYLASGQDFNYMDTLLAQKFILIDDISNNEKVNNYVSNKVTSEGLKQFLESYKGFLAFTTNYDLDDIDQFTADFGDIYAPQILARLRRGGVRIIKYGLDRRFKS